MVAQSAKQILQSEKENENNQVTVPVKKISIDPKTWIKLGHFHLLLEEYRKGINIIDHKFLFWL